MKKKTLFGFIIPLVCFGLSSTIKAKINSPIMGWSSWNTYRVNISENLIRKQANALINTGLKEAGYNYVNIDDGYFGWRDSTGLLHSHPQRFPNGMKPITDYIHSLGMKAGIYSDAGSNTCGYMWDHDINGIGSGLYGHEKQDAQLLFKEWGFDFIKIDYCGAGQDLELDERQRYEEIYNAFNQSGCGNVTINICRWAFPGTWAKNFASSWRISSDIRNKWSSVKYIIEKNLYLSAYVGKGYYNDMDMLEIGRGLKSNEEEVHFGIWCMMSSPLLIGCDLTTIPKQSLLLLKNKELIDIDQDSLGLQAQVVQHDEEGYVLVKDIQKRHGVTRAVALYNPSDTICHFIVPMETLEFKGEVRFRDLIHHKYYKLVKDELSENVPAHSAMIFKAEGEQRLEPTLYEAECAYLPCYDELGKKKKPILYAPINGASGGMGIINLGGSKDNYAEWNDVYSEFGGHYDMTIKYVPKKGSKLIVDVNGKFFIFDKIPDYGKISSITLPIVLNAGNNIIKMGSPYCWAPDIDCFTLKISRH